MDRKASGDGCSKTIWFLTVTGTVVEVISVINRIGAIVFLDDYDASFRGTYFWHNSTVLCELFTLTKLVKSGCMATLFYKVVRISPQCKEHIEEYNLLWYAAEIQAYLFMVSFIIVTVTILYCIWVMGVAVIQGTLWQFEGENPDPIQVNHGIHGLEMMGDIKTRVCLKAQVSKAEEDEKECSICQWNEKTHACIPCGHMCLCAFCAEDLSKRGVKRQTKLQCPLCRLEVDNVSRIYH